MKRYEKVEVTVLKIDDNDVLTASGETGLGWDGAWGDEWTPIGFMREDEQ